MWGGHGVGSLGIVLQNGGCDLCDGWLTLFSCIIVLIVFSWTWKYDHFSVLQWHDMCSYDTRWSAEKNPCFCKISQELFQCGNDFLSLIGHPTLDSPLVRFHWLKCPIQMPRDIQYRNNGYFLHKPVYFTNTNANAIPVRRNPVNNMVHRCEKFSGLCGTFLVTLLSQWSN